MMSPISQAGVAVHTSGAHAACVGSSGAVAYATTVVPRRWSAHRAVPTRADDDSLQRIAMGRSTMGRCTVSAAIRRRSKAGPGVTMIACSTLCRGSAGPDARGGEGCPKLSRCCLWTSFYPATNNEKWSQLDTLQQNHKTFGCVRRKRSSWAALQGTI